MHGGGKFQRGDSWGDGGGDNPGKHDSGLENTWEW
jgi:hypothetical protein